MGAQECRSDIPAGIGTRDSNERALILNADDFGFSTGVNEAIILAHRKGLLTSCSLMPGGAEFAGAVKLAFENPELAVGIHVTCVDGKSVLPWSELTAITDRDGNFTSDPAAASLRYFLSGNVRRQLFGEVEAQFERFFESGLACSHIDSHCHMHVNPALLAILIELGEKYGVKRMRVPDEDFLAAAPFLRKRPFRFGYYLVFRILAARMRAKLRERGFGFARRVYGNLLTGAMGGDYVLSLLEKLPPGLSEIYFHPILAADPVHAGPREIQGLRELRILTDPELRCKILSLGIIPASYHDLDRY